LRVSQRAGGERQDQREPQRRIGLIFHFFMDAPFDGNRRVESARKLVEVASGSMPCSWRRKIAASARAPAHHLHGMLLRAPWHHVRLTSAAVTDRYIARLHAEIGEMQC
jgi:hypothetical protein